MHDEFRERRSMIEIADEVEARCTFSERHVYELL